MTAVSNAKAAGALADSTIHEQWVAMYRTPEQQRFYELAFDEIARRLAAPAGASILDAGCGSCAKSVLLAARGFKVTAMDFSADALKLAEKTVAASGTGKSVVLKQGSILEMPFKDGEFEYAICWGVLMHIPDLERALSELSRVLAPGGILVISEGNVNSVQSVTLRALKKLLGKGRGRVESTPAGLVTHEETPNGKLVTRQTDMRWLAKHVETLDLELKARFAGQFTELYTLMPWRWLRSALHAGNNLWFRSIRLAGPSYGNILMFQKRPARP